MIGSATIIGIFCTAFWKQGILDDSQPRALGLATNNTIPLRWLLKPLP